mgnify:FL=1
MNKKYLIRFLKAKHREAYTLLTEIYCEVILEVGPAMALDIIHDDLLKEAGEDIPLNYTSLAHAIKKYKRKTSVNTKSKSVKWEFLDAHELTEKQLGPGKFKLPHSEAGKGKEGKSKAS